MSPAVISIAVLGVVLLAGAGLVSLAETRGWRGRPNAPPHLDDLDDLDPYRPERAERPDRPRWHGPGPWVLLPVAVMLVALFVAPRLLGVTFLFLPLLFGRWRGARGRWTPGPGRPDDLG